MPDTATNRYNTYFGFFVIGIVVFILSLLAGWLETLYAVFFFLAGVNLVFTTSTPKVDPEHSTTTHFDIYSRDNVFNYLLAAIIVLEALLYFFIPISKPILILVLWLINIVGYPRFADFFILRVAKKVVGSYLGEQLPELNQVQIKQAVNTLNANPTITAEQLGTDGNYSAELAARLISLYNTYVERTGL